MSQHRTSVLAAALALVASFATTESHAESLKSGYLCGFTTITDPTGQDNTQTGEIDGGPIAIVDDTDPTIVHTGHLTCTIQVGSANSTHAGPNSAVVSGPDTPLVVDVPPSQLTYSATSDDNVYICSSITTEEGTWYFADPNDPTAAGFWSTSNTVDCGLAISASAPGGPRKVYPSGTIEITRTLPGSSNVAIINMPGWSCSQPTSTSVRCTPPDAPNGYRNACGTLVVTVSNSTPGWVDADTGCTTGPWAWASAPPLTAGAGTTDSGGSFAWTCEAQDYLGIGPWTVKCTVGPRPDSDGDVRLR